MCPAWVCKAYLHLEQQEPEHPQMKEEEELQPSQIKGTKELEPHHLKDEAQEADIITSPLTIIKK